MNRAVTRFIRTLPAIVRNTHLDISLSGWPATVAILGACGTAAWVAWIALKMPEEPQLVKPIAEPNQQEQQAIISSEEQKDDHGGGDAQKSDF